MSLRHIDSFFTPRTVAVYGASDRPGSVGATVWRNLRLGGFDGALWAVNPRHDTVGGEPAYRDTAALPEPPELAVVCTPAAGVPALVAELAAAGTRAAVVLSAGLDAAQKQAMLDAARPALLRILGPNCLGLLAPGSGLNASFAHVAAQPGRLAFVSQSGALVTAMLDWAQGRGIGFSRCISLGEHADVDFGDLLDWLAGDAATRAILLYIESIEAPRKFMSAARAAARNKPVILVKAGRSAHGQAAAASHTGALAGSDVVFDAAIRRAGMLRVDTLQELFTAAEALAHLAGRRAPLGEVLYTATGTERSPQADAWAALDTLTLVTNGGGAGVMAADAAAAAGVELAPLGAATRAALDAVLPATWSRANPVDLIGDAPVQRYVDALRVLLDDPAAGTLLFMHAPTAIVPSTEIAAALTPLLSDPAQRHRVLASWLGDAAVREARQLFRAVDIACHDTPEQAVRAFAMQLEYRRNQAQLIEAPPAADPLRPAAGSALDLPALRAAMAPALAAGRPWLTEPEAKAFLAAAGIPVLPTREVPPDAEAAAAAAEAIGFPVALKIISPQITHKSDVGGVALALADAQAVREAAAAMLARVAAARPEATLQGLAVQRMVQRTQALELIVGAHLDPLWGPVVLFGQGGTRVEVVADRAVALPPLNLPLARALVQGTRVAKLLAGWREVPPADRDAVCRVLVAVSDLLAAVPEVVELDINPLLADAQGVLALDARVRVDARRPGGAHAFAIRPYPAALERRLDWHGRALTLRPIRPEDESQHLAFLQALSPADVRLRVFYSRQSIERSELARLTQIDYEREMAFIATAAGPDGRPQTLGVARAVTDPDNEGAEYGVVVRSDLKGGGLGRLLMDALIDYQRSRGTRRLHGTVLRENAGMLALCRDLGFELRPAPGDPEVVQVSLVLNG